MTEDTPAAHPADPEPVDDPATTGDDRVDAALSRLDQLDETPTQAHPQVYEDVHRELSTALGDADGG